MINTAILKAKSQTVGELNQLLFRFEEIIRSESLFWKVTAIKLNTRSFCTHPPVGVQHIKTRKYTLRVLIMFRPKLRIENSVISATFLPRLDLLGLSISESIERI